MWRMFGTQTPGREQENMGMEPQKNIKKTYCWQEMSIHQTIIEVNDQVDPWQTLRKILQRCGWEIQFVAMVS